MTEPPHHHVVPPLAARGRLAVTRHEMVEWGVQFGHALHPPLVVAIAGEVGAGKTTLVQAICRGCGITQEVTSPTFALVHEYRDGRFLIYHLDLYRLSGPSELTNLGWDDIITDEAVVLVEWPERAGHRLPDDAVPILLEHVPEDPHKRLLMAG